MSIYKMCDIRGRYGTELRRDHAVRLAEALVALKGPGEFLVGGDGRVSTPVLKSTLIDSLVRMGCRVIDLGMVPTPQFYYARQRLGLEIGVMVTASHNPAGDNGFKITLGRMPITPDEMEELAKLMENATISPRHPPIPDKQRGGRDHRLTSAHLPQGETEPGDEGVLKIDLHPEYLSFLAEHTPDLAGLKVVVDCANGMAGLVARQVWGRTGAEVRLLLDEVDGHFPVHAPNPAEAKNLALLQQIVIETGSDLGVAYDGDADRVAFVDERGQMIVNDKVIVIFARQALRNGPQTIVFDQKCSRIVPDAIKEMGGTPVMELSGHTFIKRSFLSLQAAYAGELSGHHFLRLFAGDDGIGASLIFARLLKEYGAPLSELAAGIPSYPITPDLRLPVDLALIPSLLACLEESLGAEAQISKTDGLRIEFVDGWGLVRPSVTEPVITLRFEAVDEKALLRILQRVEAASPLLRGRLVN